MIDYLLRQEVHRSEACPAPKAVAVLSRPRSLRPLEEAASRAVSCGSFVAARDATCRATSSWG